MLCLPVFIILPVLSSAAGFPVESELQRDLTQESPKDLGMRNEHQLLKKVADDCCVGKVGTCCR
uniref:Conotoxin n=1 Tax=Conus betulinus TaxID=89764 RepID=S4UKA5_CONBE|nr:T superfamily conotoxin Bt5.3 precursor [Conus betulinus]